MKIRELQAILRRRGFCLCRRGNHSVWIHPQHPDQRVVLSGTDGEDAHDYQIAQVCKGRFHRALHLRKGNT